MSEPHAVFNVWYCFLPFSYISQVLAASLPDVMSYVLTPPVTSPVIDQSDTDDAASTVSLDSRRESIHRSVDF